MKNYLTTTFLILLCLALTNTIWADTFTIEGRVLISEGQEVYPIPGIDITASSPDGQYEDLAYTDEGGYYSMSFEIENEAALIFYVSTVDWCTGDFLQREVTTNDSSAVVDFILCGNIETPDCNAAFGFTESTSLTVGFYDYSTPEEEVTAWHWDFGDGNTSTEQHPTHTFAEDGEYYVTLFITTDSCESAITQYLWAGEGEWNAHCFVWFFYDFPTDDLLSVYFEAFGEGEVIEATWDFGDGNSSTELTPTHIYEEGGVYEVTVDATVTNGEDTCSTTYTEHICLDWEVWSECDAWFSNIYIEEENNTVAFFNLAWAATEIIEYNWDFGDGNTSNEANPVHDYAANGIYDVTLTILSADSCSATSMMQVYIDEETQWQGSCQSSFYYYNEFPGSTEMVFINTSWAVENIISWTWDFGDGATSAEEHPIHNFEDFGEYEVTLTITTDDGCESSETYLVWIEDWSWELCQADFWYYFEEDGDGNFAVQFEDGSWENPIAWSWDFGDGTTSNEQNPLHLYTEGGLYTVTLDIITADSCTSIMAHSVWLDDGLGWEEPDCQAMFWFDQDEADLMTLNFIDMSAGEELSTWTWDFGDGATSQAQNPTHTYTEGGAYLVSLTIESGDCSDTFEMLIWTDDNIFYNASCQALFQPIIEANEILLLDMSIGAVVEWSWDLGDGTTSNEPLVIHSYAEAGTYTISLTIVTVDGCTSTFEIMLDSDSGDFHGDTNPSVFLTSSTKEVSSMIKDMNLYPNPVQSDLKLDWAVDKRADYQIQIVDARGQVVYTALYKASKGEQTATIPVQNLTAGVYMLRLQSGQTMETKTFMKF